MVTSRQTGSSACENLAYMPGNKDTIYIVKMNHVYPVERIVAYYPDVSHPSNVQAPK